MQNKEVEKMKYEAPTCELLLLTSDILMGSDENELEIDKLSSIFNLNG